jgi:hypothetical protein
VSPRLKRGLGILVLWVGGAVLIGHLHAFMEERWPRPFLNQAVYYGLMVLWLSLVAVADKMYFKPMTLAAEEAASPQVTKGAKHKRRA